MRHRAFGKNNYSNSTLELPTRNKGHRDSDLDAALMWRLSSQCMYRRIFARLLSRVRYVFVVFVCLFVCSVTIVLEMLCCFVLNETNPYVNYRTLCMPDWLL